MRRTEGRDARWWLLWAGLACCLAPGVFGGFACLSNPCLFGICIDDINSTFSCYCIDGYTGVLCQTNWDECWSSPCLNGGLCEDGIADFNCTCSSGFQGDNCEVNVNECASNPCSNNGTCIDAADGYTCVCGPGFSGPYCEQDIAVCNATDETRCENGGLCIDGLGVAFQCICPPGWEGVLCEVPVDECASSPCRNGAVCLDHHANYSCACPFGYSGRNCEVVLEMCGTSDPCENDALCLIEDWLSVCYCVPDFHGDRCQFQYDECLLGQGCKNGGTCIDGVDQFTCSCPLELTGDLCECLIINEEEMNCSYVAPTFPSTPPLSNIPTTPPTVPTHVPTTADETTPAPLVTDMPEPEGTTVHFEETSAPLIPTFHSTASTASTTDTSERSTEELTTDSETTNGGFTSYNTVEVITSDVTSIPITEDSFTLLPTVSLGVSPLPADESTSPASFPMEPSTKPRSQTTVQQQDVTEQPSEPPPTESVSDDITTEFAVLDTTSELFFPTGDDGMSSTEQPTSCRKVPCLNGGMCLNTATGLRCVCKAGWEGMFCEEKHSVRVAAFSGQSFVSHRPGNTSHTRVDITARTVAVAGLILYSHLGPGVYLALYLEDGLLKFKFSCGLQTMLLSEVQFQINNGFDLVATVTLEFLPPVRSSRHCLATVRVNNTLAMSGEQMSVEPPSDSAGAWLHLGGVPPGQGPDLPLLDGFVGCMHNLIVDMQPRNIFKDAIESNDIKECLSLACLSSPCHSGATCLDRNNSWTCLCPSGYLGAQCEKSVCDNNPCEYGGSCVAFPGSGFICLCPLGKHGQFCEYDLDIGHPVFSSSVAGLSSFSAHPLPTDIHQNMVLSFKFIPHDMEQISLMVFLGQDGPHGPGSDHLAVSFIKGYVVLTWNLGSGPRRIFTARPVEDLGHRPHVVQIGRDAQKAWLVVDNLGNVTGKSPGPLTQLNTRSVLYLGGHDSGNFSLLPHDLPLHTGFSGCLYDARLQTGHMMIMLQQTRATTGRSVGQCGTSLCHEHACQNGGGCIHHGATFTCLCADGWFGPSCGLRFNPCDTSQHNCSHGATCVPLRDGYSCDCPLGKTGDFCEKDEELSDVRLSGQRSYLAVAAEGLHQHRACLDLEVMPTSNQGLLLYTGRADTHSFLALSLQGGVLELRISPGRHRRRGEPLVIRSRRLVALGRWHRVRAARYGRRLFLWVEGTVNSAMLLPGETLPPSSSLLYIGGVPDLSTLPAGTMAGHVTSFQGCVRRFASQWRWIRLNSSTIAAARNIADCDGSACGGDVCDHGGSCFLNEHVPSCKCTQEYTGGHCETQLSCLEVGCKNGGRCVHEKGPARCSCPVGRGGSFCETETSTESPYFGGESYMLIDRMAAPPKQENALVKMTVDFVYMNFTTARADGMLLWTARNGAQEFLGVGVEDGLLKVVWAWEGEPPVVVVVPGGAVADGTWHDLAVSLDAGNVSVWADHRAVAPPQPLAARPLSTDGRFFLGGFPEGMSVELATQGHFSAGFEGCLQKLAWSVESVISNFSNFPGENVGVCDPFEP